MIKIIGTIVNVLPTIERKSFKKRNFWLKDDNEGYPNTYDLELWKDDVTMIDNYQIGDNVTCYVDLKGQLWKKSDGSESVSNTLKCWNIEKDGKTHKAIKSS